MPPPRTLKAASRRAVMLADARTLTAALPGPGEAVHCLMTGRFDLMMVLVAVIERLGPCVSLRVATLSYNRRNLDELSRLMAAPDPPAVTLLCSAFFRDHNGPLWEASLGAFRPPHRLAAARCHAKVACLAFASGVKLALEGSANLRTNSNAEQLAVVADAGLHDWHAAWIDEWVTRHGAGEGQAG